MTSNRPYLIRALYEWIADNDLTPHLLVNAMLKDVVVPRDYVVEGRIVLNVAAGAVQGLLLGNDHIQFSARFGGKPFPVEFPVSAVLGIYARENGHGMLFSDGADDDPGVDDEVQTTNPSEDDQAPSGGSDEKAKRPALRVVK
jgi:stringent starvation protein B